MKIEKRLTTPTYLQVLVPIASVIVALLFSMVLLVITGEDPILAMSTIVGDSISGWTEVLVNAIPLMIVGVGIAIAFKMVVWNIGAEGQMIMGMFFASGIALFAPQDWPLAVMIPVMFVAAMIGGGLWALLSGLPKAIWNVNEVITSLLLNYVAVYIVQYFVYGPWKGADSVGFPQTTAFPVGAVLPSMMPPTRLHYGLVIAVVVVVLFFFLLNKTRWGYEIRVIGESRNVARYSGMSLFKNVVLAMFLSGALAGLAGAIQVSALSGRLTPHVDSGIGYTAIIVAWLSRLNPIVIAIVSIFMGALLYVETTLPTVGIPQELASVIQGIILFFVIGGDFFARYKIKLGKNKE